MEIARAKEIGIPVFFDIESLYVWSGVVRP